MCADKSIFAIELETGKWDQFKTEFDAYHGKLGETVAAWKAAAKEINNCLDAVKGVNQAMKAGQSSAANDNLRDRIGPPPSRNDRASNQNSPNNQLKQLNDTMVSVRDTMTKRGLEMARQIGSYGGGGVSAMQGGVEGIIASVGKSSVVAAVVSMAAAAVSSPLLAAFAAAPEVANLRRQAMGLGGLNLGTIRAAQAAGSWMDDPMQGIRSAVQARRNMGGPQYQAYAMAFGAGGADRELGQSPGKAQFDLLDKVVEGMNKLPERMQDVFGERFSAALSLNTIRAWQAMSEGERRQHREMFEDTERRTTMSAEDAKAWQFFYDKMKNAGEIMESGIIKRLTPLTGPLGDMSIKFAKWVDDSKLLDDVFASLIDTIKENARQIQVTIDFLKATVEWMSAHIGHVEQGAVSAGDKAKGVYVDPKTGKGEFLTTPSQGSEWNPFSTTPPAPPPPTAEEKTRNDALNKLKRELAPPTAPDQPPPFQQPAHPHTRTPAHHFWSGWGRKHAEADLPAGSAMPVSDERKLGPDEQWALPGKGGPRHKGIGEKIGGWFKGGEELKPHSVGDMNWGGLAAKFMPPWMRGIYNTLAPDKAESGELPLNRSGARPEHPHSTGQMPGYGNRPSADAGAVAFETGNAGGGWKLPGKYEAGTLGGVKAKQTDEPVLSESKKTNELLSQIKDGMDRAGAGEGGLGAGGGGGGGPGGGGGAGGGSGAFLAGRFGRGGAGAPAVMRARSRTMGGGGGGGPERSYASGRTQVAHGALKANQQAAYDAAIKEGMDPSSAKAMVANLSGESLANPADVHADPSRRNPNQKAHGIASWDDERSRRIAKQFGKMPNEMTVAEQVHALAWETKTFSPKTWSKLTDPNRSAEQKVGTWVGEVERPANVAGEVSGRIGRLHGLQVGGGAVASAGGATSADADFFSARKGAGVSGKAGTLNAEFAGNLKASIQEAEKATGEKARFTSLTRDYATQARLRYNYEHHIGGQGLAAKPGTSLHERGMAADLAPGKVRDYMRAHAGEHGMELVPGDPEHVQMAKAIRAHASDQRLADVRASDKAAVAAAAPKPRAAEEAAQRRRPGAHQGGGEQTASNAPLHMGNWQLAPRTNVALNNKTGSDVHISASTMAG